MLPSTWRCSRGGIEIIDMRGWTILIGTFVIGVVVGFGVANRGPALIAPYVHKASSSSGERIEGQVVRKQREGNRLLVKINTAQGPMLVTFTQKVADFDVLLDPGDTVTLTVPGYATFVEDPVFERIKAPAPAKSP
jgi:TOBE domain